MDEYGEGVIEQSMPGGCLSPPTRPVAGTGPGETPIDGRRVMARPIVQYPIDLSNSAPDPLAR